MKRTQWIAVIGLMIAVFQNSCSIEAKLPTKQLLTSNNSYNNNNNNNLLFDEFDYEEDDEDENRVEEEIEKNTTNNKNNNNNNNNSGNKFQQQQSATASEADDGPVASGDVVVADAAAAADEEEATSTRSTSAPESATTAANNNNFPSSAAAAAQPQLKRPSFANPFGQLGSLFGGDQLQALQEYSLLFQAERHTIFRLHTAEPSADPSAGPSANATASAGRVLHVVSDTIGAAFGVTKGRGVATRTEQVRLYDAASLRRSRFNPFNPTRILIHGWFGGSHAGVYSSLVPAYLRLGRGHNVFTVDWGRGALADYVTASFRVKPVGRVVARFIDFLVRESGCRLQDVRLVGFSMGAHAAGIAGKSLQSGRLPAIYALDPALPLFRFERPAERVDAADADYVEVVHTSAGSYGYDRPLGHADFYVGFGSAQPGCFFNECSHFRAFQVFADSLSLSQSTQPSVALVGAGCDPSLWQDVVKRRRCPRPTGRNLTLGGDGGDAEQLRQRRGLFVVETGAGRGRADAGS